jgi:pantetheine-phosphate adenylyltransferase
LTTALYPGSFDPVTNGHLDIINRAASLFDLLIIGVYDTPPKHLSFTTRERADMMAKSVIHLSNVRVETYTGLTISFAHQIKATVLVRGLRMSSDFEREFEMSLMNKKVAPDVESVFLMASLEYQFLSSSLLKEVATLGSSQMVKSLVPPPVMEALKKKNLI